MRFVTLTFSLLLIVGISKAQKAPIDVHGFNKTFQLEELLTPINLQSDIFMVQGVTSDEKHLYVYNSKETPIVKAYRLNDGKYMGGFGTLGQGPREFHPFLFSSSFNARKGQIVTQDRKYVRIFNVKESADELTFEMVKEVRIPTELDIVNQGILLKDDLYAGSIMFTEKDFVTFPLTDMSQEVRNNSIGNFGDYPQEYPEIPFKAYHHLYQGNSSYAYEGDALVRYYSNIPLLRLFNLPDGTYRDIRLKPKHAQIKKLIPDSREMSIQNGIDMVGYFSNAKLGEAFIVADYLERKYKKVEMTERGNMERVPLSDRFLLVFNKEGDLLAKRAPPDWVGWYHVTSGDQLIWSPDVT